MDAFLTVTNKSVAFSDTSTSQQPQFKHWDWPLSVRSVSVQDPKSYGGQLAVGETLTIFDGTRTTQVGATTSFNLALSTLDDGSRYRFSFVAGTDPVLRTDRALTLDDESCVITVGADSTIVFTATTAGKMSNMQAGDQVFIPGELSGDAAGPFDANNTGWWEVLAVPTNKSLQMQRLSGEDFNAVAETKTVTDNTQVQGFTAAGVQVGDSVTISAGFAAGTRRTYTIEAVTAKFFEVLSTTALAAETSIEPNTTGIIFYSDAKRFLHLEVDQEVVARLNTDSTDNNWVSPVQAGDARQPGWLEKFGPCHKIVLVNKSSSACNYVCYSAR